MTEARDELESAYQYSVSEDATNLYAKLNALTLYEARGITVTRPRISAEVPDQARQIAHDQLAIALCYLVEGDADECTDEVLRQAAQSLERCYIDKPEDTPDRSFELHQAALAYYLSGQYARAFVLLQGLSDHDVASDATLMGWMFLRQLSNIRASTFEELIKPDFSDSRLATAVLWGRMEDLPALQMAYRGTLYRIYSLVYEFARTGVEACIDQAVRLASLGRLSAIDETLLMDKTEKVRIIREYGTSSIYP